MIDRMRNSHTFEVELLCGKVILISLILTHFEEANREREREKKMKEPKNIGIEMHISSVCKKIVLIHWNTKQKQIDRQSIVPCLVDVYIDAFVFLERTSMTRKVIYCS